MSDDEVTVTVPLPEPQDVVAPPPADPVVVVVEDNKENSSGVVISEIIDLAVADVTKDQRIAELEDRLNELESATLFAEIHAQEAIETSLETSAAVEELTDPVTTSADDDAPRREHGFWRTRGRDS